MHYMTHMLRPTFFVSGRNTCMNPQIPYSIIVKQRILVFNDLKNMRANGQENCTHMFLSF